MAATASSPGPLRVLWSEVSVECNGKAGLTGFGFLAAAGKWRLRAEDGSLKRVVEVIEKLRGRSRFPFSKGAAELAGWFQRNSKGGGGRSVCSVCRTRPAKRGPQPRHLHAVP